MASASRLKNKEAPATHVNRCWSWEHWRPVDVEQFGPELLKGSRYDEVKKQMERYGKTPQLQCIHCSRTMAWNPSTKRKLHLIIDCTEFLRSPAAQDVRVAVDRDDALRKEASAKNVRSFRFCIKVVKTFDACNHGVHLDPVVTWHPVCRHLISTSISLSCPNPPGTCSNVHATFSAPLFSRQTARLFS
jgi:hypothetical protein